MAKNTAKPSKKASSKSAKSAKKAAPKPRLPLSESQVKALLAENAALRAFRTGTVEGRSIARTHPTSGEVGDEAAKFAAKMGKDGYSYREIEAGMGLAAHNGMSAYRLVIRGKKLLRKEGTAAKKTAKVETTETVETPTETVASEPTVETPVEQPAEVTA